MSRLGYQIPNFTLPGIASADVFSNIIKQAEAADRSGFDRVTVMDHFYQLPNIGAPSEPMLECYTLLAALAQHTSHVRLSSLVTGNTYRNPTLLAKTVTALDHVSHGRATLGIGAGWFELEHNALGYEFGTFTDRFEKLEEALQIILPMLRGEPISLAGKHYTVEKAINSPAPLSKVPIMIGGGGEKKTLRMVAQYADESNLASTPVEEIPRKLEALVGHCERLGRDRSEVSVTSMQNVVIAPTAEQAEKELVETAVALGWKEAVIEMAKNLVILGDPDTVGEKLQTVMDTGVDGLAITLAFNGHIPERIELLGEIGVAVTKAPPAA